MMYFTFDITSVYINKKRTEHINYEKGLCPIAEALQPYLIQLKTNFESLDDAKKQAIALKKTIKHVDNL